MEGKGRTDLLSMMCPRFLDVSQVPGGAERRIVCILSLFYHKGKIQKEPTGARF